MFKNKLLFQKNGMGFIPSENIPYDLCIFIINNYNKDRSINDYKKEYYKSKGSPINLSFNIIVDIKQIYNF